LSEKEVNLLPVNSLKTLPIHHRSTQKQGVRRQAGRVVENFHIMNQQVAVAALLGFPEEQGVMKGVRFKQLDGARI
jgi:hypothetical protein